VSATPARVYLDASALVKFVIAERESAALRRHVDGHVLVSSRLADTEVRRAAGRQPGLVAEASLDAVAATVFFIELTPAVARAAGDALPPTMRSLDAIHLATALAIRDELSAMITYDLRLRDAAQDAGITVFAPS
jgi:predicted nucleic acid-binding protein